MTTQRSLSSTSPPEGYDAAREGAAVRDASHWARFAFSGGDHLDFLHRMSTNHFRQLEVGQGLEAVLTDQRGRIIDLGTFYRGPHVTLAVFSPPARTAIPAWLERFIFAEAIEIADIADEVAMLELIGPQAAALCGKVHDVDLGALAPHQLLDATAPDGLWLARMDWAGRAGLRAIGPPRALAALRRQWLEAGALPLGEEAWNILRVEEGYPVHGAELSGEYNPWEAGLGRAIHMDKGCYIGQEVIARLDTYDKVKQYLVGLFLEGEELPDPGSELRAGERRAGVVTSAVASPTFGPIALAYVRRAHAGPDAALATGGGGARVSPLPFRPA